MAIKDINQLASNEISRLTNEFNYYALANLGQRFGISGDSVITDSFILSDLLYNIKYDEQNDLGVIRYYKDYVVIGTINKKTGVTNMYNEYSIDNINNYITTPEDIILPTVINNVDTYNKKAYLGYNPRDKVYYWAARGVCVENDKQYDKEYIIEAVDEETGEFICSYRIENCPYINDELCIDFEKDKDATYYPTIFCLTKTDNVKIKDSYIVTDSESKHYALSIYKVTLQSNSGKTVSLSDLINDIVDNYVNVNTENIYNYDFYRGYIVKYLKNIDSNIVSLYKQYDVIYNTSGTHGTQMFSFANGSINDTEFEYLSHIQNDLTNLYPLFIRKYSELKYYYNNTTTHKQILISLLKKVINDAGLTKPTRPYDYIKFYCPLEYVFSYFKSDNTKYTNIYTSNKELYVQYIGNDDRYDNIDYDSINILTIESYGASKVSLYSFVCNYVNVDNISLLNDIYISKDYTLPYINSENYWTINDKDTTVYAKGKNAGQPNIILLYNGYDVNCELLTIEKSAARPLILHSSNYNDVFSLWDSKNFNIEYWENKTFNYVFNINSDNEDSNNIIEISNEDLEQVPLDDENIEEVFEPDNEDLKKLQDKLYSYITANTELIEKYHPHIALNEYVEDITPIVHEQTEISKQKYYYTLNTRLPKVSKYGTHRRDLLKNCIIINITDVQNECYRHESLDKLTDVLQSKTIYSGSDFGNITTFWVLNETTNSFECIKNPEDDDIAMDFNYISMVDEYIDYIISHKKQKEPDNYTFTQLLFDNIHSNLKNNSQIDSIINNYTIYPNIRTIQGLTQEDYYDTKLFNDNIYNNPANLLIEFNSYVSGVIGEHIDGVSQSQELTYYSSISNGKYIANLFEDNLKSFVTYYTGTYEYVFNGVLPTIEAKEVVVRNPNVLNRTNIVSLDNDSNIFYAYIGTSYNLDNKNILHIGTYTTNFSWGTNTLSNTNTEFKQHDAISIDFNNTYINGDIYTNRHVNDTQYIATDYLLGKNEYTGILTIDNNTISINTYDNIDFLQNNDTEICISAIRLNALLDQLNILVGNKLKIKGNVDIKTINNTKYILLYNDDTIDRDLDVIRIRYKINSNIVDYITINTQEPKWKPILYTI